MKKIITAMLVTLMSVSFLAGCTSKETTDTNSAVKEATDTNPAVEETTDTNPVAEEATEEEAVPVELTVLAAASLTDVTKELADLYKEIEPNVTLTFSYGASGALQTQIEEGAPADLFLSAATKQMDALEEGKLLLDGTKKELLINKVVLIVPKDSTLGLTGFEDVGTDTVKTIALGEPESVPVGQYSEEVFTSLGILDAVKAKANYGSDVKQVLTWVESGEVDCGVVYSTDAIISDKVSIVCEAPEGSHKDIIYPAAVIGNSEHPDEAKAFLDFLSTEDAAEAFERYGFTMK
ncbi:molybdate ABC transporter substrate-binding protein [Konateibacter massiliensis]|uniref:molybdate ABC transporter substrate-binding protein n=1 Tax=Konateibacter massiliensis TaxID=2002841 RepID=UPI001F1689BA|nr:molybdate ABC transporter substrate-binding protein [Konateibacter massiliensis]